VADDLEAEVPQDDVLEGIAGGGERMVPADAGRTHGCLLNESTVIADRTVHLSYS
jgi:hypothetical protein